MYLVYYICTQWSAYKKLTNVIVCDMCTQDGDLASHLSDTVKQVQQLTKEKDDIQRRLLEEMENIKDSLDEAINDRDELKYQISELLQEKEKLLDRIASTGPGVETGGSELDKVTDQRDLVQIMYK